MDCFTDWKGVSAAVYLWHLRPADFQRQLQFFDQFRLSNAKTFTDHHHVRKRKTAPESYRAYTRVLISQSFRSERTYFWKDDWNELAYTHTRFAALSSSLMHMLYMSSWTQLNCLCIWLQTAGRTQEHVKCAAAALTCWVVTSTRKQQRKFGVCNRWVGSISK